MKIAHSRFINGETSQRDEEQAQSELSDTEAQLPQLETSLQQAKNALSVLLGVPPQRLGTALGTGGAIPTAPLEVAVGIPADLLRRRPDIRLAEQQAATQSALIGVNEAELFPAFSFTGSFGLTSSNVGQAQLSDVFNWGNRVVSFGPAVQWNILNYGQITNKVRAQDAVFQQAILSYQNTVLRAQKEVEDALIAYLNAQLVTASLTTAVAAAKRSAELALIQYREGQTDYTTVLTAQQTLASSGTNAWTLQNLAGAFHQVANFQFLPHRVCEVCQMQNPRGVTARSAPHRRRIGKIGPDEAGDTDSTFAFVDCGHQALHGLGKMEIGNRLICDIAVSRHKSERRHDQAIRHRCV